MDAGGDDPEERVAARPGWQQVAGALSGAGGDQEVQPGSEQQGLGHDRAGGLAVVRLNRGMVQTVVFPNSANELEIIWKKGHKFKKIDNIIIRKGNWRTPEGIGIGTTKKELEAINGKAVTLFPLGEDEFRVVWNGGKVHPKLAVSYSATTDRVFDMLILF